MANNFTKAVNSFIDKIGFQKTYMDKSMMCSGNKYFITLSYKGQRASFVFHDNYLNRSTKQDIISCLVSDAKAYEQALDLYDFCCEFGYMDRQKARKAYEGCRKQSERLHRLFTDEEIALLAMLD